MIPGEYFLGEGDVVANEGRRTVELAVANTADRPIQVGSHFHFFEANRALEFDRAAAFGMRLDISASTAVRFEPGDQKDVTLVPFGGKQRAYGFNGLVDSWTGPGPSHAYRPAFGRAMQLARDLGFKISLPAAASEAPPPTATAPSPAPPKRTAPPSGPKKKGTR